MVLVAGNYLVLEEGVFLIFCNAVYASKINKIPKF